jgi:hypothetical protein
MINREIEWVIWKLNSGDIHKEVITHHLRTAATYVSWYIEMCDNWNDCERCNELICKNTQNTLNKITSILKASNINETQKKELAKIPTIWLANEKALNQIHKILNWAA